MRETRSQTPPQHVGVKQIPTNELEPNPYNPRRLFDRQPLATLEASIRKVGVLVPLTVYWDEDQSHFVILDGQRRWICAKKLALPAVPANVVAKPSLVTNIVTMFQIHKLREDWELMPSALTLEILMRALQETKVKPLAELTGLDQAVVVRCKKLLSYPRKFQDLMLDPDPERRIKADFFIELYAIVSDRNVKKMEWFSRDKFTGAMLSRYSSGGLRSVTDFRTVKQHINNAAKRRKLPQISRRLERFARDSSVPIEYLEVEDARGALAFKAVLRTATSLENALNVLDVEAVYGEEKLWSLLIRLDELIRRRLREADRRGR